MKLNKNEKEILSHIVSKVFDNILYGENCGDFTTDESLIFAFDVDDLSILMNVRNKLWKDLKGV